MATNSDSISSGPSKSGLLDSLVAEARAEYGETNPIRVDQLAAHVATVKMLLEHLEDEDARHRDLIARIKANKLRNPNREADDKNPRASDAFRHQAVLHHPALAAQLEEE